MMKAKRTTRAAALFTACLMLGGMAACTDNTGHTHAYGEWIDEIPATCTDGGTLGHYHCDGCGKDFDAEHVELDGLSVEPKGHTFATALTYDDGSGHYYAATCEHKTEKKGFTGHTLVTSADGLTQTCVCGYENVLISSLAKPTGLHYESFVLTFEAVEHATSYTVEFTADGATVKSFDVTETTLDVKNAGLAVGAYTVKVTAKRSALVSESATLDVTVKVFDGDVILEAEDALLNPKHYSADRVAHGGGYALDIDDCGQGLYFRYYAYEAGERDVDVAYSTATADSFMAIHLNGEYARNIVFEENTGWFGDSKTTATATVKLAFVQGWNEIYFVKDGTDESTPAWGGNVQIDYIKIHGTENEYDAEFDKTSESYRLEAECADWHYTGDTRPISWPNDGFSQNYGLGAMDAEGDGVKFSFKVAESGAYLLQLAYGGPRNGVKVNVSVNGEAKQHTLTGSIDWNNVVLDGSYLAAELTAGETVTVDYSRLSDEDGGSWFTVDYLLVTKVDHVHDFTAQDTDAKYLVSAATCTDKAVYRYSCTECGEAGSETFVHGEPNGHAFADTLSYDDDVHYYAATCGHTSERKDPTPHTFVENAAENIKSCACGYSAPLVSSIDAPTNIAYANGTLTFSAVTNATSYDVVIKKGATSVHTSNITETALDVAALGLEPGKYTVSVTAKCANITSETATAEINVLVIDGDVILEAEDALLNPKHYSADPLAHGGAYGLAFNDCGQGMYYRYYAYEAGEKNVDVVYATGSAGSFMNFYLNGTKTKVLFSEYTNWFGDAHTTATATVTLTFAQGWNEFYLIKDDGNGGWAQIDYIKVHGSGKGFDSTAFDLSSNSYKLEAECAAWHWADGNQRPAGWGDGCSLGYALGEINAVGDGVKFTFKVAETGTYKLQVAYGSGVDGIKFNISVNDEAAVLREHDRTGSHNVFVLDEGIEVELTAGQTVTVDIGRAENSQWLTFDYLLVTKVEA